MLSLFVLICAISLVSAGKMRSFRPNLFDALTMNLEKYCPSWDTWQENQCWWPDVTWENIPQACRTIPNMQKMPAWFQNFAQSKAKEDYGYLQYEFQQRGQPQRCGYCSRRQRCRIRQPTTDGNDLPPWCKPLQIETVYDNRQCPGTQPCEISVQEGMCEAPMFMYTLEYGKLITMGEKGMKKGIMKKLMKMKMKGKMKGGRQPPRRPPPFRPGGMMGPGPGPEPEPEPEFGMKMMADKIMDDPMFKGAAWIIYNIMNGTNCGKDPNNDQSCLCCCGPYVPDLQSRTCRDFTPVLQQAIDEQNSQMSNDQPGPFFSTFIQPLLDATEN